MVAKDIINLISLDIRDILIRDWRQARRRGYKTLTCKKDQRKQWGIEKEQVEARS